MPDGRYALIEHHNPRHQRALAQDAAEASAGLLCDAKERAFRLIAELGDAFDEIERERPGSMDDARNFLGYARSEVEGTL